MTKTQVKSVCPYCGVGCGIVLEVEDDRVVKVSGDKQHPANYGRLCTKGLTSWQVITDPSRLKHAYIRTDRKQELSKLNMKAAISETARQLRAIMEEHGPDALSFYVSGQMTLEAQYLINKLAKGFIGTNQIESNSRLCMASAGSGYKLSLGADGPPGSYQDIDAAQLFLVIGANMADCHPILFMRMMDRVKKGARLIVVDPRRNGTADKADLYMQITPGTDLALLNGLLHLLVQNNHIDSSFIAKYTTGWNEMLPFLEGYTVEKVAAITGISEEDIRQAAQWIGESKDWMTCWTMGLNQSTHGTWNTNAICNLHLATGAICRIGSGPFSLTGQPNAMGGREMGYMGPGLPGQRSVLVEADRRFIEDLWRIESGTIRSEVGQGTISMFQDMQKGNIKACWIICTNPVASVANRESVIAGLQAAELVIVQDCFIETETNCYADILLPGALWAESDGVMINSERNMTLLQQAVCPPGEAMPDWEIIAHVACEMGYSHAFSYTSASDVFEEIKQTWNPKSGYDIRGASYERLRETPLQWPIASDHHEERNPIRYRNDGRSQLRKVDEDGTIPVFAFPTESGKGIFWARPHIEPAEMPDEEYPFVLNTGRLQHQWHTLTKTGKIEALNKLNPGPFVEMHPSDAVMLGLQDRDPVLISSRRGKAILPAVITDRVRAGHCFTPFHWNDRYGDNMAINAVTNDAIDPISQQPEFKYCAVKLMKVTYDGSDEDIESGIKKEAEKGMVNLAQLDTLAKLIGIDEPVSFTMASHEKLYLDGFMASLRAEPLYAAGTVPVLPPNAPIEQAKRYWVDGMLAGLYSRTYLSSPDMGMSSSPSAATIHTSSIHQPAAVEAKRSSILLLWASQTGTAEAAACASADRLRNERNIVRLSCMDTYAAADLLTERHVLFVVSTFGSGEPPDNGLAFWNRLNHANMPRLHGVRYSVLALGDSSYDTYCAFGSNLDARLKELGAEPFVLRTDCEPDYEENAREWLNTVIKELAINSELSSKVDEAESISEKQVISSAIETAIAVESEIRSYDRHFPLKTKLVENRLLTGEGSAKEIRHYVFDLKHTGMRYEAGDALGVWPSNCPSVVREMLEVIQLNGSDEVLVDGQGIVTLEHALLNHVDLMKITTKMLRCICDRTCSELLAELLMEGNREQLKNWLWGRPLIDVLHEYSIQLRASEWIKLMQPLKPRMYSISSSPRMHPDEVHLTVSTVRYKSVSSGISRKGVCSTFLADYAEGKQEIPIFVQQSKHFRVPTNPDTPMIMVGPGTGIAPFRAFLQERQATGARGKNWLFFGEQCEASEFYYQDELEDMLNTGVLNRLDTAFSRDQEQKIYVQNRMLEQGQQIYDWLEQGASFYVCGDASRMAIDVHNALKQIIQRYGGFNAEETEAYVAKLVQSKRYMKDVYS